MTKSSSNSPTSLRDRTRERVRADIAEHAMILFAEHGFDEITVDQIAAAVGISPRSFFRYFATKEDVVMGDILIHARLAEKVLRSRPNDEDALTVWRYALGELVDFTQAQTQVSLRVIRIMTSTPSLRARHLEKQLAWAELLVPGVAERLTPGSFGRELPARAIVLCGLACLDIALARWAETDGKASLSDLLDTALNALSR